MDDSGRLFKQVFIAVIYVFIFAGLGTGIYFLVRPTPVPPAPAPKIEPIQVIWKQSFVSGSNVYSAGAKITNPNTGFGSDLFPYTFYLYDADGTLLATRAGETFLWPGESKYLIEAGINDVSRAPVKVELALGEPKWKEVKNFKGVDLFITNSSYGKGKAGSGKFFEIGATAVNDTSYNLDKVNVSAVVFSGSDLPIAVNSTVLENLKSKERRPFSIPWFSQFPGTPASIDLSISTNLWERPELLGQ